MKTTQQKLASKSGFTLIEVIAVLVILGVLAAVAIPRYINLIDDAREKALDGAVAAGLSHVSLAYGSYALEHGVAPTADQLATAAGDGPQSEDYTFDFEAVGETGVDVEATEVVTSGTAKSTTKRWSMP